LLLFNIAVDNVLDELSENTISEKYEYNLHEDLPNQSVAGFADDVTLITNGIDSAMELAIQSKNCFENMGMKINISKCSAINLKNGKITCEEKCQMDDEVVKCISQGEVIKYLRVDITDEIVFDRLYSFHGVLQLV